MKSFPLWKPGQYERIFRQKPPREVHISDIRNFKDCRQRWHFASVHRLAKVPNYPNRHLWLGRAVHYALAAYYSSTELPRTGLLEAYDEYILHSSLEIIKQFLSHSPYAFYWPPLDPTWRSLYEILPEFVERGLPDTIAAELPETAELGRGMLEYYGRWAAEYDGKLELNVHMPELSFSVPVPGLDNVNFAGTVDAIAETRHGIYLLENKTCTQFPDFLGLLNDDQAVGYVWAAQRDSRFAGMRPKGVIFTFIRKKLVAQPRVLKSSGKLSQDRKQDTTYRLYLDAIKERDLDPADYQDILNFLIEKPNNFVRRARIDVFPSQLEHFERELHSVTKQILDPDVPIYTEGNWFKCSRCAHRVPCTLVRHGADPMPYLNWEFREREIEKVEIDEGNE